MKVEHRIQECLMQQDKTAFQASQRLMETQEGVMKRGINTFDKMKFNILQKMIINTSFTLLGIGFPPLANTFTRLNPETGKTIGNIFSAVPQLLQPLYEMRDLSVQQEKELNQQEQNRLANEQSFYTRMQERANADKQRFDQIKNPNM